MKRGAVKGLLRFINPGRGFGFIELDDGGEHVFVHISQIVVGGEARRRSGFLVSAPTGAPFASPIVTFCGHIPHDVVSSLNNLTPADVYFPRIDRAAHRFDGGSLHGRASALIIISDRPLRSPTTSSRPNPIRRSISLSMIYCAT